MVRPTFKYSVTRRTLLRGLLVSGGTLTFGPLLAACASGTASPTASQPTAAPTAAAAAPTASTSSLKPQATSAPASSGHYSLRLACNDSNYELGLTKKVIALFEKQNPSYQVKVEPIPGDYATKMIAEAAANTLQDVMYTADVFTLPFAVKGVIRDMMPFVKEDKSFNIDDIYSVMLKLGETPQKPGGLFMLPQALDILVLFYNKTMFDKASVGLPTAKWTIQDLVSAAKQLTHATNDPKTTQYGINASWNWWAVYVPWMRGYGGDMMSADGKTFIGDQPAAVAGIQAMAYLTTKDKVAPPPGMSFGGDPFALGHVAMTHATRDSIPQYRATIAGKFDWDVQLWPAFPKKHVTGMGTQGFAFTTASKQPEQAWTVTKFFVSKDGQKIFASTYSAVPSLKSMANDPSWRSLPPPPSNNDVFIQSAAIGTLPPVLPLNCGSVYTGQVNQLMNNAFDKILRGTAAQQVLSDVGQQINACVAQNG